MPKLFSILFLNFLFINQQVSAQQSQIFSAPEVVGEGTISSSDFEFNFTHTQDKRVAYFSKALLPDWRRISILKTSLKNNKWSTPTLATFSGQYRDTDPFITPDETRLYFISDRPSKYQKKPSDYAIWYVAAPFDNVEPTLLEGDFYVQHKSALYPSLSSNGNLYFCSPDSLGKMAIHYAVSDENHYTKSSKLNFCNSQYSDLDPVISPDESFIIFVSNSRKGQGGQDLFVSFNKNGIWSEPVNLGKEINSSDNEGQPGLSSDGKTLYFTSRRNKNVADYKPRDRKISDKQLLDELQTPFNGLPNIWQVDISNIKLLNK